MPHYFFHLHDGCGITDDEGAILATLADPRRYAADFFGSTVRDAGSHLFECKDWRLNVMDADGLVLFVIQLSAFDAPAIAAAGLRAAHQTI